MPGTFTVSTLDVDLKSAGDAWIQSNSDRFLWPRLPTALTLTVNSGFSGRVNYRRPPLDQFMLKGELGYWRFGQDKRESRGLSDEEASFSVVGRDVTPISRPMNRSRGHRLADIERNIVPGMLSEFWQGLDKAVVTALTSTASFGSAKTFTGSAALDNVADHANQAPIADIMEDLRPLRKYAARPGSQLWCVLDEHVADVLAQHPDFTGAGYRDGSTAIAGNGVGPIISHDALAQMIKLRLRVDEVHIMRAVSDTVVRGQSSALKNVFNGVLWFGVVHPGSSDLRDPNSTDTPEGAIVLGIGEAENGAGGPSVRVTPDERRLVEHFDAEMSFGVFSPRGFGLFYTSTGSGGIFTTLPS